MPESGKTESSGLHQTQTVGTWAEIRNTVLRLDELRAKAAVASEHAWVQAQKEGFLGQSLPDPNLKGLRMLGKSGPLSEDVRRHVLGHGIINQMNLKLHQEVDILIDILATGEFDGDCAPLSGVPNSAWISAPFVLLSNYGENLVRQVNPASFRQGAPRTFKIASLRAVFVNGEYEDLAPELEQRFPWVDFRTSTNVKGDMFNTVAPQYQSYLERVAQTGS